MGINMPNNEFRPNDYVTRAEFEPKGSTTTNASLLNHAKEAARKAKFNADENAPEEQKAV